MLESGFKGQLLRIGTPPVPIASARSLERSIIPDEALHRRSGPRPVLRPLPWPHPQTVPCVNINDEVVQVVSINVKPGEFVKQRRCHRRRRDRQVAASTWWPSRTATCCGSTCRPEQKVRVGSVMLWLGDAADEPVPEEVRGRASGRQAEPGNPPPRRARC